MYIINPLTGQWKHLTNIAAARGGPAVVGVADNILVIKGKTNNFLTQHIMEEILIGIK